MLICQVQDVEAALEAKAMGADIVVAQGAEAGGHGAVRATLADLIDRIEPASTIIERIGNQAEAWLSQAQKLVTESVDQTGS